MSGDMSNNPDTKPASYPQDSRGCDHTASPLPAPGEDQAIQACWGPNKPVSPDLRRGLVMAMLYGRTRGYLVDKRLALYRDCSTYHQTSAEPPTGFG